MKNRSLVAAFLFRLKLCKDNQFIPGLCFASNLNFEEQFDAELLGESVIRLIDSDPTF